MSNDKSQHGTSLYLALMIVGVLLSISFGISAIFLERAQTLKDIGYSVLAFYGADTGIEKILLDRTNPVSITETFLSNGASYQVIVTPTGSDGCAAANFCIKSIGKYKETNRAIEISY